MSLPRINVVETATPSQAFTQDEILDVLGYRDARRRGFFRHSDIDTRRLAFDLDRVRAGETLDDLSARFRESALALGASAARRALARGGWEAGAIDFIVTTTSTGRMLPGLDARLLSRLGCRSDIQRVHVGDTGCCAAMVAIQQAWNHLRAFPDHRVLVVAVEICSATYTLDERLESAVAHAIFADGAAAAVLSTQGNGPEIVGHRTLFRPEHLELMGFDYPAGRPRIVLSKDVRRLGPRMMRDMADAMLDQWNLKRTDVSHWVLHSAGRRVLDGAERLLGLDKRQIAASRHVLSAFGNMSSATILFVLREVMDAGTAGPGDWGLMIGVGPGAAAEGAVLRW